MADEFAGFKPASDEWANFREAPQSPVAEQLKDVPKGFIAGAKEYAQGLGGAAQSAAATIFPSLDPGAAAGIAPPSENGSPSFNMGRMIGGAAASVPVSYLMPGAFSENFLARLASGAASGGITGAAMNPDNIGEGAVLGAIGGAIPGARPAVQESAKALMKAGIRPSLGQTVGGWVNNLEQTLTGIPGVGDMIKNARYRPVEDLNITTANSALSHIGESLDPKTVPGRGMIAEMDRKIGGFYDQILPHVTWQADPQTVGNMASIIQNANLTDEKRNQLINLVRSQFSKAGNNNTMNGDLFKDVDSKFGNDAAKFISSNDADQRSYGEALFGIQKELRDTLRRSNPQYGDQLDKANAAWAEASRVRYAAGGKDEVFGPGQFSNAVKHEALTKAQYARGQAKMQDLSDAAVNALGPTVPDSGTPTRLIGAGLAGLAGGAVGHESEQAGKYIWPFLAANAAGMGIYSPPGQAVARSLVRLAPKVSPFGSALGAGILSGMGNQ